MHDGSIPTLEEMVRVMARHQLAKQLEENEVIDIVTFLRTLTGEIPHEYIERPELPARPKPDEGEILVGM
jgi:cytochrome c peroxidase